MMRLRKLDLALFGHFTDHSIDFGDRQAGSSDFHIIYGPNEAGKTTVMEGYLRLLYGFPGKDAYAFKHQRANLRVAGTLEIDGAAHSITRLSSRTGNLIDSVGNVVPETLLHAALGGLAMEDYRKLLCLDDETIEAGGDEITKSKGDIGRLLFSAAAGISDLSQVLDTVEERTLEIYRKGGSKSTFAVLKREHEAVGQTIKEHDVSASTYRTLREASEQARAAETDLRAQKKALLQRKVRLAAVIKAHPLAMELTKAEAALAPIKHYPGTLDIDPEMLVKMMTSRVGLVVKRDRAAQNMTDLQTENQALTPRPDLLQHAAQFEGMGPLKSSVESARLHLPKRAIQLTDEEKEMSHRLSDLGIKPDGDLNRYVLSAPHLATLELHRNQLRDAERDLKTAQEEAKGAAQMFSAATNALENAQTAVTIGPDLGLLLARYNADALLEKYVAAVQEQALSKRQLIAKLTGLTRLGVQFQKVPTVGITATKATDLASKMAMADQKVAAANELVIAGRQKWDRARVAVEVSAGMPDLISDAAALKTRTHRDVMWTLHRSTLDVETADAFETAMQADDTQRAIRDGQTKEIAEHRHAIRVEIESRQGLKTAKQVRDGAKEIAGGLHGQLNGLLESSGLPKALSAEEFAQWVRQVEEAQLATVNHAALRAENSAVFDRASALERALAKDLEEPEAALDALVAMARRLVAQRADQEQAVQAAHTAVARETTDMERRKETATACQAAVSNARRSWDALVSERLPDTASHVDLLEALPTLRALREINERMSGIRRQIDGMKHDRAAFADEIGKLAPSFAISSDIDPLEGYTKIGAQLSAARRVEEALADINQRIATESAVRNAADAEIETLDAQVRELASSFDPSIQTTTLSDLRQAVTTAARSIALRTTAKTILVDLLAMLAVDTRESAQAELDAVAADLAKADLQEVDTDITRAETALDKAIEDKTGAKLALEAVVGDSEIAALVARKRTIEAQMEAVLLQYLDGRLGHSLADRAIRRYRDTHRSGMMAATEKAFSNLTNGAYSTLTAQPGAGGDVLMAIQASDQVAKEASAMSKGTRFQLYLALRAAAYEQMASNGMVLPFFCDDVFETFDEPRTRAACSLMQQIGETGQAIYLTHHQHVVDIARDVCAGQVRVSTIAR
jgi:uncharacterized protein YhaN